MTVSSGFYTYLYLRENDTPYYVGKGSGNRAFVSQYHVTRPPKDKSRIIIFPMPDEATAFESEIALIELFGRKDLGTGILRNLAGGGSGSSNPSKETRLKMRAAHLGLKRTPEHNAKQSVRLMGNIHMLGKKHSIETRAKMSAAHIGKKHTAEHIANYVVARKKANAERVAQLLKKAA